MRDHLISCSVIPLLMNEQNDPNENIRIRTQSAHTTRHKPRTTTKENRQDRPNHRDIMQRSTMRMNHHRSQPPLNDRFRKLRDPTPRSSRPQSHHGPSSVLIVPFLILETGRITTMINDHASWLEIKQRFEGDMMNGTSTHHQHINKYQNQQ